MKRNERMFHYGTDGDDISYSPLSLQEVPLLSFKETITPLVDLIFQIENISQLSVEFVQTITLPEGMNLDEAAAINLYTREWLIREQSLYYILNQKLKDPNRSGIVPFLSFLRLFLEAIRKLKPYDLSQGFLYRGIGQNLEIGDMDKSMRLYKADQNIIWWGFYSTGRSYGTLIEDADEIEEECSHMFIIHRCERVFDISRFSSTSENEILVVPPVQFTVKSISVSNNGITLVDIEEDTTFKVEYYPMKNHLSSILNCSSTLIDSSSDVIENSIEEEFKIGMNYFEKSQFKKAHQTFEKCSKKNYPPAYLLLSYLYNYGGLIGFKNLIKKNFWLNLCKQYSSFFQEDPITPTTDPILLFCKAYFQEMQPSSEKAFDYYSQSAHQGYMVSQYHLARCYEYGFGTSKDLNQALKYYQLSSEKGFSLAQNTLGDCYQYGKGIDKDLVMASKYYQLSAYQGFSWGQNNIGVFYAKGLGVQKDLSMACKYYLLSAEQGYSWGQNNIGVYYENGTVVNRDIQQAIHYYRLSSGQGNSWGQYNLGRCYENGFGITRNFKLAFKYYQLSADQKYPWAQYNLGRFYDNGWIVAQDINTAVKYYQLSADQGNSWAQFYVGYCLEIGRGTNQNIALSIKYYLKSTEQGYSPAQQALGRICGTVYL